MLTPAQLKDLIQDELLPAYNADKERQDQIVDWLSAKALEIFVPRGANAEYEMLRSQSKFNVLKLIVKQLAQDLFVDGYRSTSESGLAPSSDNAPIWRLVWQPNRMDARQRMPYRAAIQFGWSYATVLPGTRTVRRRVDAGDEIDPAVEPPAAAYEMVTEPVPVITPWSPRRFVACYDDELNDEWATYAMHVHRPKRAGRPSRLLSSQGRPLDPDIGARLTVYDDGFVYDVKKLARGGGKASWDLIGIREHGMGVVPVVRWLDEWDCDEMPEGKIWPLIAPQKQLDQATFQITMIQNFASWMQRWISGMAEEAPGFRARIDAVWKSTSAETKFGEFSASDPGPVLRSREAILQFISAVAQVAPHQLVLAAGISNISADALVALQTSHDHDVGDHKTSFGESDEQLFRLGGLAVSVTAGATQEQIDIGLDAWYDTSAQVVWRDTTPRSLAQIADALGKLATQLGIPPEALWERIPGVTQQDIERWREMRGQANLLDRIEGMLGQADDEVLVEGPEMEEPALVGVASNGSGAV